MNKYQLPFFTSFYTNKDNRYTSWDNYASKIYNIQNIDKEITVQNTQSVFLRSVSRFGKETHAIHDIVHTAQKYYQKFVLINSDIEIDTNTSFWNQIIETSQNGIVIGHRFNYDDNFNTNLSINDGGIDFFILNDIIVPQDDNFCIGLCGWDWWLPFLAVQQNIPIYRIHCPFLYHKRHEKQWSKESLNYIVDYMFNLTGETHDTYFKNRIINKTISLCKTS
jgi:hypothetical protein